MTPEITFTPGRGWTLDFDGWTIVLLDDGTRIVLRNGVIVALEFAHGLPLAERARRPSRADGVPAAADWLAPEDSR